MCFIIEEEGNVDGEKEDAEDTDGGECDFGCLHLWDSFSKYFSNSEF